VRGGTQDSPGQQATTAAWGIGTEPLEPLRYVEIMASSSDPRRNPETPVSTKDPAWRAYLTAVSASPF
jgi:hypothetical protein